MITHTSHTSIHSIDTSHKLSGVNSELPLSRSLLFGEPLEKWIVWASRLGYRAKKRKKHARPNIIFVDLWSQTHQNIHSRKIFYNACSVAMLSARMLMLCSGAQWSSSTWSVWRTRELLFIWWAPRFRIKSERYRKSQHVHCRQLFQCHVILV